MNCATVSTKPDALWDSMAPIRRSISCAAASDVQESRVLDGSASAMCNDRLVLGAAGMSAGGST
jgi:hypothetical protein